jgi:hypothetical protein
LILLRPLSSLRTADSPFNNHFDDLIGKLDMLRVACDKCGRDGCYGLGRLIEKRGRDAKLIDWLDELTAECPKKIALNMNDPCGARCRDLARVL